MLYTNNIFNLTYNYTICYLNHTYVETIIVRNLQDEKTPSPTLKKGGTTKSSFYKWGFSRNFYLKPCIVFEFKISYHACIKAKLMKTTFLIFTMN